MTLPAGSATAASVEAQAAACAAEVLEVLPAVMNALRSGMRNHIGEGLSVPQFRCLNFVEATPGASITEAATFLGVSLATASAMVDRLVRAGYVLASTSAEDRRRSRLHISASGRSLLRRMRRGAQRELASALGTRSAAELSDLMDGFAVLRATFGVGPATVSAKEGPRAAGIEAAMSPRRRRLAASMGADAAEAP
jgi:DNA-binding MarR family transcriptional regulator